ncbi:unnamed protein product [Nezara viridula]|uniref:Uncharacterized protein n=1 Tax=Nezara viridula TaxID=85310 RepID=A0A9P0HJ68_NEZVI|nr:unnamed protein product [Nezara viridula]
MTEFLSTKIINLISKLLMQIYFFFLMKRKKSTNRAPSCRKQKKKKNRPRKSASESSQESEDHESKSDDWLEYDKSVKDVTSVDGYYSTEDEESADDTISSKEGSSITKKSRLKTIMTFVPFLRKCGPPLKYDPEFKGPRKRRSCTDIICLFLFTGFVIAWVLVGIFALKKGNPEKILRPTDSSGRKCGLDSEVIDRPYLFFFDLTKCADPSVVLNGCDTPQINTLTYTELTGYR